MTYFDIRELEEEIKRYEGMDPNVDIHSVIARELLLILEELRKMQGE